MSDDEKEDNKFFAKLEQTYCEENIFSVDDLKDMIKKEKAMLDRNERGYYRCRQRDKQLYDDMMSAYAPYITTEAMKQLNHNWHTQNNEAMNTSVSAFAPKGKTYSRTNSLVTRVSIAAGISIAGHDQFWKNFGTELDFTFDANFMSMLRSRDRKKESARLVQRSKAGKSRRSQGKTAKQNDVHKTQLDAYKEGTFYECGVVMSLAKKTMKAVPRNPEGTPADQWKCPYYHPLYCTLLGHSSCSSKVCGMKYKSKVERAAALKVITAE